MPDTLTFEVFDDDDNTVTDEVTARSQNRFAHMLRTGWFWTIVALMLALALGARLWQAGKDAYTGDWSFSRSMAAFPAMFGGFGSLLACLAVVVVAAVVFLVMWRLANKNHNVATAFVGLGGMIVVGLIGLRWIDIEVGTALGIVASVVAVFILAFVAGLAVTGSKHYTVPPKIVPDTADSDEDNED